MPRYTSPPHDKNKPKGAKRPRSWHRRSKVPIWQLVKEVVHDEGKRIN